MKTRIKVAGFFRRKEKIEIINLSNRGDATTSDETSVDTCNKRDLTLVNPDRTSGDKCRHIQQKQFLWIEPGYFFTHKQNGRNYQSNTLFN